MNLDPNELALTIIDQAMTIRRMGAEIDRLRAELARQAALDEAKAPEPDKPVVAAQDPSGA